MVQITEIMNVLPRQTWLVGGERLENSLSGHNMESGQDGVALVTSRAGGKEETHPAEGRSPGIHS